MLVGRCIIVAQLLELTNNRHVVLFVRLFYGIICNENDFIGGVFI